MDNIFHFHETAKLATATHNFKWVKITFISTFWIKSYANLANA